MTEPPRPDPQPVEPVGADRAWGPSPWFLAVALGLVAGTLAWWMASSAPALPPVDANAPAGVSASTAGSPAATPVRMTGASGAPAAASAPVRVVAAASGAPPAAARHIPRLRDPNGDQTPDLADYVNEGETPTMAEVIDRLHQAGVQTGLGAFNPPGTRPPLVGLAVPEGFALPEGYVRHYQATDDGQRIEPILMFAPGYQLVDAAQQPVAMPPDRVVPPELAPPGMPIRRIVVPAPSDAVRPGR